jgi:hypothetical protein
VSVRIRELGRWRDPITLMLDGGAEPLQRPRVHVQAAAGGYLRLVGPDGPWLWGLVDPGWYFVTAVRAKRARLEVIPPIRAVDLERAPRRAHSVEHMNWWTRYYARGLVASDSTPLASGRTCRLTADCTLKLRHKHLELLLSQREEFEYGWDSPFYAGLLLTRELSDASDGRVKMWRKRAREGSLPPLLVWWCRGWSAYVLLDGHDRVHAALLDDVTPEIVVLADVVPASADHVDAVKRESLDHVNILETLPSAQLRADVMNAIVRAAWDPRTEWDAATPGFAIDGGVEHWMDEVRGTLLEAMVRDRDARESHA